MKWINQIMVMLKTVHQTGVVWEDAKLHDVLIDQQNSSLIPNFIGSYIPRLIDEG